MINYAEKIANFNLIVGNKSEDIAYNYLSKTGWDENKGPTKPVIENNRLFGRGSVDDGYASFSILTAIKACQDHNCPYREYV